MGVSLFVILRKPHAVSDGCEFLMDFRWKHLRKGVSSSKTQDLFCTFKYFVLSKALKA